MRQRWPAHRVMALLLVTAVTLYFLSRWLVMLYYPLQFRTTLFGQAQEFGLDPYLVAAVIRTESGFRPNAVSKQGARGLMQIMPQTAEWIAIQVGVDYSPEQLFDPDYNIQMGCWYLATLIREFDGEIAPALAAYNAGRSNVKQWLVTKEWTGDADQLEGIPFEETRLYVSKVLRDEGRYRRIYGDPPSGGRESHDAGTELIRR